MLAGALLAAFVAGGGAASSTTVISMAVPSAITLTNDCTDPAGYRFGVVQPGVPQLTSVSAASVCGIEFTSSNDSAMLRASQADGASDTAAMSTSTLAWNTTNSGSGDITDISFAPGTTTGWAVGRSGLLLRSVDGGDTWAPHACTPCGTQHLYSVAAVTASSAFVGGRNGQTFRWNGTSWEALPVVAPANDLVAIDSPDGINLWGVAGDGYMWKSANANLAVASVTWTQYQPTTSNLLGVDVVDANTVFAVGDSGTVVRTTNGGADLALVGTGTSGSLRDVAATSATIAVIVNSGGVAFDTTTGTSWTSRYTGMRELLTEVVRSGSTVYAASELGRVAKSTDGGASWASVSTSRTVDHIYGIAMVDPGPGTVVIGGRGGNIQRTADDGASWTWEYTSTPNFAGVAAVDGTEAFAVGDRGEIRRTTNAGATWAAQASPTNETLRGVALSGTAGDRLIAVGDQGTVVTTTDGATWTSRSSGTSQRLRGVAIADGSYAWAVGDNGTILRSTSGGENWSAQTSGTALDLLAVAAVSKDVAWAVGGSSTGGGSRIIVGTTDGGITWTQQVAAAGSEIASVSAVSATRAMALSRDGRLYQTSNGSTWTNASVNGGRAFAISMVDADVAFLSYYSTLQRTTDGGATWSNVTGASWHHYKALDAVDPDTVIATGGSMETSTSTAGSTITDYGAGPNNWAGATSASVFGVCLQAVGAGTTAVWTPDTTGVSGQCELSDADPWRALPAAPSKVASAATPGTIGRAEFVFGMRPATTQLPGTYYATVVFEALAPNS